MGLGFVFWGFCSVYDLLGFKFRVLGLGFRVEDGGVRGGGGGGVVCLFFFFFCGFVFRFLGEVRVLGAFLVYFC